MKTIFSVIRISQVQYGVPEMRTEVPNILFTTRDLAMEFAKEECRHVDKNMTYCGRKPTPEAIVQEVGVFETLQEIEEAEKRKARRIALNKLTPEERILLGIEL